MSRFCFFASLIVACLLTSQTLGQLSIPQGVPASFHPKFDLNGDNEFDILDLDFLTDEQEVGFLLIDNIKITSSNAGDYAIYDLNDDKCVNCDDLITIANAYDVHLHVSVPNPGDPTPVPPDCVYGDFNGDTLIDHLDVAIGLGNMAGEPGQFSVSASWMDGDCTGDGIVNGADFERGFARFANVDGLNGVDKEDIHFLSKNCSDSLANTNGDWNGDGKVSVGYLSAVEGQYLGTPSGGGGDMAVQMAIVSVIVGENYSFGDANLDGLVNGEDFEIYDENKFKDFCGFEFGDFNCDGIIDLSDFNLWNSNKEFED